MVVVIHALWREGLVLWSEGGEPPALVEGAGTPGTLRLSRPTRGMRPLPSPELPTEEPPSRGRTTLKAWPTPTVSFGPDAALEQLAAFSTATPDGPILGASLRHLTEVAAFAVDLVARGRLLPSVDHNRAVWRPVLTGGDAAWARALVLAMPPAARAAEPTRAPADILTSALDALVDAAARNALPRTRGPATTAWQRWFNGLTGRERGFIASVTEAATLERELRAWQRDAVAGTVRASFHLVEPVLADDDLWRLEFWLQAPTTLVEAEAIWAGGATGIGRPQETLLKELGRAARLYDALDTSLRERTPTGLDLDASGAHAFLREGAPMLAGAGFGVQLPGWWSKPQARLGARLRASSRTAPGIVAKPGGVGLNEVVDYEWELSLGDEPLTKAELRALTQLKAPLVKLRGQWVELDARRLASALKMISQKGELTVGELLQLGVSTEDGPGGLPVVAITAEGALGDLLSGQAERRVDPVPTPAEFHGALRPYQERGLAWLTFLQRLGLGAVLADDMGLGKTATVLALLLGDDVDANAGPTLLICPMSLVGNWQREVATFAPSLRVHVHHGAERAKGAAFQRAVDRADLVITTYAIAARDSAQLGELAWHRVVIDEAQAIKNASTRQAVAVRSIKAQHRVAVTGTPVENRLADLWSIMEFANPGLLGSASGFKTRYAEPVERRGDDAAADRLKRLTGPFILRRVKTDKSIISDLPEKIEMEVFTNLTAEQAALYQAVVDDALEHIENSEGMQRRGLVLATMTRLKQVCNHPAHFLKERSLHDGSGLSGRSGKLQSLEQILDEVIDAGERALLFTQYAEFGGMLRSHLAARFGREVLYLHGGVSKQDRDTMVSRFQAETPDAPALFVLSLKAGGTGLTLTAANHVIHVDRWWNPAVEDQATDRAFRLGQRRDVQVRKFVCAGTVEEKIAQMINEKKGLAAKIVGTGEQWITGLSTSELRSLFALEAGAVVE